MNQPQQDGVPAENSEDAPPLTTGEMARRSSNTLRTVRFYEEEGILRPIRRTEGGHRLFDRRELERLMLVTDLRSAGLSLDEIKQILLVKQSGACGSAAAKEATALLARRIEDLRDKLIAACSNTPIGSRNRAIIAVGYDTLCRGSELVGLGSRTFRNSRVVRCLFSSAAPKMIPLGTGGLGI